MRRAFTLVELLVTITIVAMLVALLAPALAGARSLSRNARCGANLRSIAQSDAAYRNDFKWVAPSGKDALCEYNPDLDWLCAADRERAAEFLYRDFEGSAINHQLNTVLLDALATPGRAWIAGDPYNEPNGIVNDPPRSFHGAGYFHVVDANATVSVRQSPEI